jgi:hypothetical protein
MVTRVARAPQPAALGNNSDQCTGAKQFLMTAMMAAIVLPTAGEAFFVRTTCPCVQTHVSSNLYLE